MDDAHRLFGAAISEVLGELDWDLLGRTCCEGDGAGFFDAERRALILDTGLMLAGDLGAALGEGGGSSLYVGAEIAELPVMLAEHLVLGRHVEWLNVDGPATRELGRAIAAVNERLGVELPTPKCKAPADVAPAIFDHLWLVSVLSDPEHFPALHDELYGRAAGPLATGRGRLEDDRRRAERIVDAMLDRAAPSCVFTTTDEERTIVEPLVARRGWSLDFPADGRVSAIVGDRVCLGTLRRKAISTGR